MKHKLLLLVFLSFFFTNGQFNRNAPWMKELRKSKVAKGISKSRFEKTPTPNYTFKEITDAFDQYWQGKDEEREKKGSGYKPFMRWRNYWQHFVKPDGTLPTAAEQWQVWENFNAAEGPVNPTSDWTIVGPVINGELNSALPGIGRINAIAVDPNNANVWYTGAPAGGLWKTTDGGSTWTSLFDEFPQIGVSGIAINPDDSNTILIATGDDDASDSFSIGVFKSTNGGDTWTETSINPSSQDEFDVLNEITYDPSNSEIVWVAGSDGLQKSIDGGDNWTVVLSGNITDFKLKPGDSNTIYAVGGETGAVPVFPEAQYYKSDDGGATFEQITSTLPTTGGRMVLGVSPADPETVYICVADVIGRDSDFLGIFKSTDSGVTFTRTAETDDIFGSSQAWFDLALEVSPNDSNEIYVGVLDVWRSSDGGDNFTQLNQWFSNTPAYTHADIHTLKFFGNRLFCGSDGGLYSSDDGGETFTDYNDGLAISQFYRISIAKNDASRIVGGTQDNSGFVYNNNEWNVFTGGDGMDYEFDPTNSDIAYGFTQFGGFLFITTNLGQTVATVGAPREEDGSIISGNWITPLAVDAEGEVYSAYDIVYKLSGNQWEPISNNFIEDIALGNKINDLETDPSNTQVLYASDRGFLFRSDDGGQNFVTVNPDDPLDESISDIAINNDNPNVIYVTTSLRPGISLASQPTLRGVYRLTLDNGTLVSIDDITFDLPADQAYFCIVHQSRSANNPIYVGTSLGVYRLDDTLTEWEHYSTNLPNTAISDLEISPDDAVIVASTYGRGAWQSPIPVDPPGDDVKLIDLVTSAQTISCISDVTPSVTVENKGLNPISQIDVIYSINGGASQEFVYNTNLNSGASESFNLPIITGQIGEQIQLDASISIANDAFPDNNSISTTAYITNRTSLSDELFDFETNATSLFSYDTAGTTPLTPGGVWEIGVPTGTLLNAASSGTQVIGTNLSGNYPDLTTGIVYSSCYDLSSMLAPKLSFQMAFDLELDWDYVTVIYSTDGGTIFQILGGLGSQPNWYNSDTSPNPDNCFNCPGAQWTGTNSVMTKYIYDFALNAAMGEVDLTNETNIVFGILFQSDQLVNQEGVIIDDFVIEGLVDDNDDDDDGILDINDNCPLLANVDQTDTDGDGEGDTCDLDDDNDGIADVIDICPLVPNPGQEDFDGDGIGNVCDDDVDGDGVPNAFDLCPETPLDAVVDVDGCPTFSLPADNFSLKTTDESCIASENGSIELSTTNPLNYTATFVDSAANETVISFTEMALFENLPTGNYSLCITVEGQPDFERCYDVNINEPDPLSVSSKVSTLKSEVTLELSGGKQYLIELNGEPYITSDNQITLPLTKVENVLRIKSDKDCQGIHEETIVLSDKILVYPNPIASGELSVYLGSNEFDRVEVCLFTANGTRVLDKFFRPDSGYIKMEMEGLAKGVYLLNIKTDYSLFNYKILKR
ncbi:MAG: thrombospondin type 3 repeat-containing protein [Bacteroidota bacterium]